MIVELSLPDREKLLQQYEDNVLTVTVSGGVAVKTLALFISAKHDIWTEQLCENALKYSTAVSQMLQQHHNVISEEVNMWIISRKHIPHPQCSV